MSKNYTFNSHAGFGGMMKYDGFVFTNTIVLLQLSFSPIAARGVHVKLLCLLFVILLCSFALLFLSGYVGLQAGPTIFAFLAAECLLLGIRALYVVVRYV